MTMTRLTTVAVFLTAPSVVWGSPEKKAEPSEQAPQAAPEATAVQKLDQALSEKRPRAGDLMKAMSEVRAQGELDASAVDTLLRGACVVAQRAKVGSEAYTYAFTLLRARTTAETWPCDVRQTDALWRKYGTYFDRDVQIRADFEGAFDYLHRWDTVLTTFADIADGVGSDGASRTLARMRGKVARAIAKLPDEERCDGAERARFSCEWICSSRTDDALRKCEAKKAAKARQRCVERAESRASECLPCCLDGGRGCRRKSGLVCGAGS